MNNIPWKYTFEIFFYHLSFVRLFLNNMYIFPFPPISDPFVWDFKSISTKQICWMELKKILIEFILDLTLIKDYVGLTGLFWDIRVKNNNWPILMTLKCGCCWFLNWRWIQPWWLLVSGARARLVGESQDLFSRWTLRDQEVIPRP